jgi:hypothetical protein
MSRLILILILLSKCASATAYIDTTSENFQKPEPLKTQAYEYKESKVDQYIDATADKLGGGILGTIVTGPIGLIMKVSDKVIKHQESQLDNP